MSSAPLSLTPCLSTSAPVFFRPLHSTLATWTVRLPEQDQRRVLGLWRHAPCRHGHRQQAGDLIAGPARLIHQAAERHCQDSPLRKCWKDTLLACHPPTCEWCLVSCVRPKIKKINLPAVLYLYEFNYECFTALRYNMCRGQYYINCRNQHGSKMTGNLVISHHVNNERTQQKRSAG